MDGLRLGSVFRAARLRRRWRQTDVARAASVSDVTVSRIERGVLDAVSIGTLTRVARALEIQLDVRPRWRGGELDRMLNVAHSQMHEAAAALLQSLGWDVAPEVTFSVYGERGVVDVLARHRKTGTLLVVELKTAIVDVQALLSAVDRYRRLAPRIASERGWQAPVRPSLWVCVLDTRTNRRRLAAHAAVLRAALPADGRQLGPWLRRPSGSIAALSFLPVRHAGTLRPIRATVGRQRVRVARSAGPDDPAADRIW